ncbi:hypothetical protein [Sphingomonas sp.]|uniref:hypothetical protein n=1 Tax=Sphingomonas sp. TaxID=28214 RepID=UPI00307F5965
MSGFGHILAGALTGIGQGIAQQGQMDYEARRQIALENLRQSNQLQRDATQHGYRKEEITAQTDANIATDKARTVNDDWLDSRKTERSTSSQIVVDNNRGKIEEKQDERRFRQQVQLKNIDFQNEKEMTRFQTGLAMQSAQQQAQLKQQMESGEIGDIKEGSDGYYYGIRKDGSTVKLNVQAPREEGVLSGRPPAAGGGIGAAAPAPAPAPSAKPAAPKAQAPQQSGGKTYTMKEAQETAKARNITVDQVHAVMRANGYKLTN